MNNSCKRQEETVESNVPVRRKSMRYVMVCWLYGSHEINTLSPTVENNAPFEQQIYDEKRWKSANKYPTYKVK